LRKRGEGSDPTVGYDAGKQVKGRKRHLLVDTQGHILGLLVLPANVQDPDGAKLLLDPVKNRLLKFTHLWADGRYAGAFVEWVKERFGWTLEIVKKPKDQPGFQVLPRRWVVERTFAWFGKYRELSKDYERLPQSSEAMIYAAMIHRMVRHLRPP
jgi:putative transposase